MSIKELLRAQRLFFFCLAAWNPLTALPSGGEIIQGHATLVPSSETLQINANGKAILHWDSFNIASHEAVRFVQSQETQAILNRVTSGSASEILGSLQANCPLYLVNPSGVFIGSSACIETAGFLASTADLSNEAFWQGTELLFQEFGNGCIVNLGKIHASHRDVFLVARAGIDNQGSIEAPNGIAMLTTREMMLHPDTKECVFIRVSDAAEEGVQNSGAIQALAVELQTQSPYEKAIQHSGSIEAFATLEQNGRIYLVSEGGTVVNGSLTAKSGEIRVLGETVVLEAGAVIDASGEFGGGTVLVGGDYQGKNEEIKNAKHTWVGKETGVKADALRNGNGGKVIFWGDEGTFHYGRISARGGEEGGDGGLIEVSGKYLDFQGVADRRAPHGQMGLLLLDPINITISGADSANVINPGGGGTYTFSGCAPSPATINAQTLVANLNLGSVTISTSATGGAGCVNAGSITVSSPITADASANPWSAATTLTLTADAFISINAAITNTSASTGFTAMNFTAQGVGSTTNPGIALSTVSSILTTTGGNISLTGTATGTTGACHGITLSNGSIKTTGGGLITLNGTGGPSSTASHGINLSANGQVTTTTGGGHY